MMEERSQTEPVVFVMRSKGFSGPSACWSRLGFEKNWIPTVPGRAWFTYLRLYGPLEAYFDKSWPLPDIENQPAAPVLLAGAAQQPNKIQKRQNREAVMI